MKRKIISLALATALVGATVLTGCGSDAADNGATGNTAAGTESGSTDAGSTDAGSTDSGETVKVRVGYMALGQYEAQLAVAAEKDFFTEAFEGQNVEIEYYAFANGAALNEAFLSGDLEFAHGMGDQLVISGIANGTGTEVLARVVKNTTNTGLVVAVDSDIQTVEDLKGKKVAFTLGTAGQKITGQLIGDGGLTEDDIEVVNLGGAEIPAALEKGEIDAGFLGSLTAEDNEALGTIYRVLVTAENHPNFAYLVAQKSFAEAHPEIAQAFLTALINANAWYYENPDEGNKLIAEFLGVEEKDVRGGIAGAELAIELTDEDYQNFQDTYDFLDRSDLLPGEIDDLSIVADGSYLEAVTK